MKREQLGKATPGDVTSRAERLMVNEMNQKKSRNTDSTTQAGRVIPSTSNVCLKTA